MRCDTCDGDKECPECMGDGVVVCDCCGADGIVCDACGGNGKCPDCNGTGKDE